MQTGHNISVNGNKLRINELYYNIDEIQFVDVVQQDRPTILRIVLLCAGFCLLLALICFLFSAALGLFFGLCGAVGIVIVRSIKPQYALRIGQRFGTAKAIISEDQKAMEEIRAHISEIMAQQQNAPQA